MMTFVKLDQAISRLEQNAYGCLVAEEQADGKMVYLLFQTEHLCYEHYTTGAKLHAVNFSFIPNATSRLYVDWEATTKDMYTEKDESSKHEQDIRKFIKAAEWMLEQIGVNRSISWVIENRTRLDENIGKWKPSFHIYTNFWFPNNFEILPAFVRKVMDGAGLDCHWIDFGVYQPRSLLRMIGVSSKPNHRLPLAEEDDFPMCLTASVYETPDVGSAQMQELQIEWIQHQPRDHPALSAVNQRRVQARIMELLKKHGEAVTKLTPAHAVGSFYGENTNGRNCLTYPGYQHRRNGNRCVISLEEGGKLWYKCLDPQHLEKCLCLGKIEN